MSEKRQCPKCGSTNVKPNFANPATTIEGGRDDWECMECNYVGLMPGHNPDIPEEEFDNSEELEDQEYPRIRIIPQTSIEFRFILFLILAVVLLFVLDSLI